MCRFCKDYHPQPRSEPRWVRRERRRREREKQKAALRKRAQAVPEDGPGEKSRLPRGEDPRPQVLGYALIPSGEFGVCKRLSSVKDAVYFALGHHEELELWEERVGPEGEESARLVCTLDR